MRMTVGGCYQRKIVVCLMIWSSYGIQPDDFEVAKAVRMSTSVPFVFKPVEIKDTNNAEKNYYFVDGECLMVSHFVN